MAGPSVTERNERSFSSLEEPLASLEELTEACLPTLTARLWATCCWSATMDGGMEDR